MGEKAQREQEFIEKARQFEEQVCSGRATSSGPPLFKMTPTATEAGHVSPPTTPPPRRSVDRLEFMSPTDKWSQSAQSEVPVQQAATTATKTKTKTKSSNARASGQPNRGASSDHDDQDPPGPPRKPPSSSGGLGFGFYKDDKPQRDPPPPPPPDDDGGDDDDGEESSGSSGRRRRRRARRLMREVHERPRPLKEADHIKLHALPNTVQFKHWRQFEMKSSGLLAAAGCVPLDCRS